MLLIPNHYHALHDQYFADILSFASAQLCLALKFLRLSGLSFFISMLASPNMTIFSLPPEQALTTNFFLPCPASPFVIRRGELHFILSLSLAIRLLLPAVVLAAPARLQAAGWRHLRELVAFALPLGLR